jgi:pimeloyl-ACP methyl ester carboxylesterase
MFVRSEYGTYSCLDRLDQIRVSCLLVNGKYDTCQDWTIAPIFQKLKQVKWVKFDSEGSSHTPFWEDRERYATIVSDFLEG